MLVVTGCAQMLQNEQVWFYPEISCPCPGPVQALWRVLGMGWRERRVLPIESKEMLLICLLLELPSGMAGSRFQESVPLLALHYSVLASFLGRFFPQICPLVAPCLPSKAIMGRGFFS